MNVFMASFGVASSFYDPAEPGINYNYAGRWCGKSDAPRSTGGYYIETAPFAGGVNYWFQATHTAISEGFIQFAYRQIRQSNSIYLFSIYGATTFIISVYLGTDGYLHIYRGDCFSGGTLLGTSTEQVTYESAWHVLEFYLLVDDTNGELTIRKDGLPIFTYAGNTKPGSDTAFNRLRWYNNYGGYIGYTDIVVNDATGSYNNSWPNGAYCTFLRPNAAGQANWTPSAGANYACVDEAGVPNTSDYVYTNSDAIIDTYGLIDLPAAAYEVKAVQPIFHGWREGYPTPTKIRRVLRKSSTNYEGSDITVPAVSMGMMVEPVIETDPATGVPFTVSDINSNIELGIKSVV